MLNYSDFGLFYTKTKKLRLSAYLVCIFQRSHIYRSRISEHQYKIFDEIRERIAKECEFRYHNRNKNLYICLMKMIKNA